MDDSKIVTSPVRVDFHIHSAASVRTREAGNEALARCTSDKIDTLVEKLGNPKLSINMCAITDHDCFDVEMYRALKSKEGHGTLKKVLPGVEFTVALPDDMGRPIPIHVVAIFDDRGPDDLIEALDSHIPKTVGGRPEYDSKDKGAFSSQRFSQILSDIGLSAVLIGHEKSVGREQKNDVSSLGLSAPTRSCSPSSLTRWKSVTGVTRSICGTSLSGTRSRMSRLSWGVIAMTGTPTRCPPPSFAGGRMRSGSAP